MDAKTLVLDGEPDAVPRARRHATLAVRGSTADSAEGDVELVVSELVTNALLHAGPPVLLGVHVDGATVRVDVRDNSRRLPVRPLPSDTGMTGRGLSLVSALTRQWGVEAADEGKVVWAELSAEDALSDATDEGLDVDVDALLAAWADDRTDAETLYTVRLGDVPTDLLISAKAHVDNLVREFTLAARGAVSGASAAVPQPLVRLIEAVVLGFSDARQSIKRQAIEAANRGDERTTIVLTLGVQSIAAAQEYLAALDEADNYARAARVLTLETPPQHRVFRHWYVESLISQLRALVAGDEPPAVQSFEARLLAELGELAAAKHVADRVARLQGVTAALARVTSVTSVAEVVIGDGLTALAASGGVLVTPAAPNGVSVTGARGYSSSYLDALSNASESAPAVAALRSGVSVWLESPQERAAQFPDSGTTAAALCAVPLLLGDQVVGALQFTFDTPRLFDADERRFVESLAAQTSQALVRAALYGAEREARHAAEAMADRLARLQEATAAFGAATSVDAIAEILVTHAADALGARASSLWLIEGEVLRAVRVRGLDADIAARWQTIPLAAQTPLSVAVRAGTSVVLRPGEDIARTYPDLAGESDGPAWRDTYVNMPLAVAGEMLGGISLSFDADVAEEMEARAGLRFLSTLADACAQAITRSRAQEQARIASERLSFLADASSVLSASLDYRATLTNIADLVVPRIADWCSIQVVEDGAFSTVAVAHIDAEKVSAALEFQQRYPVDPDAPTGAPNVVRTGQSELIPVITDQMIAAAGLEPDRAEFLSWLGLKSAMTVPLTGRTGTFGVLSLVCAESGRHYAADDVAFVEDLARRCAIAVENAEMYSEQSGQLLRVSRVAEVTQHAILPPVPARIGPVRLATRYVSATREALIGGDLYEVAERDGVLRLIVGDVRGKGVDAVRLATVVLGEFRSAAARFDDVAAMATHMDERLTSYIGDEDFVTALLAEIAPDGTCAVVSCGHPGPYVSTDGELSVLQVPTSLPLGLGSRPVPVMTTLLPGMRVLLYTDGLIEARTADGGFVAADEVVGPLGTAPFDDVLDAVLERLDAAGGHGVADDLALLLAEYAPDNAPTGVRPSQ